MSVDGQQGFSYRRNVSGYVACDWIGLDFDWESTNVLKRVMRPSFDDQERIDFIGFCRCMRQLENDNFANIASVMSPPTQDAKQFYERPDPRQRRSFFDRKAMAQAARADAQK